jgi:hypothetical protein
VCCGWLLVSPARGMPPGCMARLIATLHVSAMHNLSVCKLFRHVHPVVLCVHPLSWFEKLAAVEMLPQRQGTCSTTYQGDVFRSLLAWVVVGVWQSPSDLSSVHAVLCLSMAPLPAFVVLTPAGTTDPLGPGWPSTAKVACVGRITLHPTSVRA